MTATNVVTAVAVCGCGHEGRLGLGPSEANVPTPTLVQEFIHSEASTEPPRGKVLAVACGGYHTIVCTTEGLYGWGSNDVGQLGLGTGTPFIATPTLLTIDGRRIGGVADTLSAPPSPASAGAHGERVVRVACGNQHTVVLTTEAVYVCGGNECGQLGLGRGGQSVDSVATWQTLCIFAGPRRTPGVLLSLADVGVDLLTGEVVHVSCGSHHTLLGLHKVLSVDHAEAGEVRLTPTMVLACGRGDFGELGYSGTADDVERQRAAARQAAALQEAVQQRMRGGPEAAEAEPPLPPPTSTDPLYKYKMKYRAVKRRPPFSSPSLRPVQLPWALGGASLPVDTGDVPRACGGAAVQVLAECAREQQQQQLRSMCGEGSGKERDGVGRPPLWSIHELHASHLHSCVVLRRAGVGETDPRAEGKGEMVSLHWGCYYCNAVEGDEASVPAVLTTVDPSSECGSTRAVCVHGGNEVCLHYAIRGLDGSAPSAPVMVMGKGNLGLGEEDSFEEVWRPLAGTLGAVKVVGRDHHLLLVDESPTRADPQGGSPASGVGGGTVVLGFGENLHGQVGQCPCDGRGAGKADSDVVYSPRAVLRVGDSVGGGAWVVERIRDVGAGSRHSVFVVDLRPATDPA